MYQINHERITQLRAQRAAQVCQLARTDAAIAEAYGPAVGKICTLLMVMFSPGDVRNLIRFTPGLGEEAYNALPEQGPAQAIANAAAVAILDHDAVPQILAAMWSQRPHRRGEVEQLGRDLSAL